MLKYTIFYELGRKDGAVAYKIYFNPGTPAEKLM